MDTEVVDTHAEMLELTTVQRGDICIVTEESKTYILAQLPASTDENWKQILTPLADVTKQYVDSQDAAMVAEIRGTGIETAYNTLAKIQEIIKSNKTAQDAIVGRVTTLEGTVGDSSKGLVKQAADLGTQVSGINTTLAGKANVYKATVESGQSLSILATAHKCGVSPIVQCILNGAVVEAQVSIEATGNITVAWNGNANGMIVTVIGI